LEAERRVLEGAGLSEAVITTALAATRRSSRSVYDTRWDAFCGWCSEREIDPVRAPLNQVLEFLQIQSNSKAVNTMKGYVTAISNRHVHINDLPLSANPMVRSWVTGLTKTKGFSRVLVPAWDLQIVLNALKRFPFEPLRTASFKFLTWKTVFLLAITSARRASELHALCFTEPYIAMTDPVALLWPNIEFMPKVNTPFHASQPIRVPSMHASTDQGLRLLCVRRALKYYLERSRALRKDDGSIQLFIAYGKKDLGNPISKQRLSRWLVETIQFAYTVQSLPVPQGIKGHQTRKQAASIAELAGASPTTICDAATWASTCTFAKFYRLNIAATASADFGRRVLQVAGASSSSSATGSRAQTGNLAQYRIPKKRGGR